MYKIESKFTESQALIALLPHNFTIIVDDRSYTTNKDWLRATSEFFGNLLNECDTNQLYLKEPKIFEKLIQLINICSVTCETLDDVFETLLLTQKYLIKGIDFWKLINDLDIPSDYFQSYVHYVLILFPKKIKQDEHSSEVIDLIAKQIKHDTDMTCLNNDLLELIENSSTKREYGRINRQTCTYVTKLIIALETTSKKYQQERLKCYFVRYNAQDTYLGISLHDNYYAHSMAEAILMFRDNLLKLSINSKKIKCIKPLYLGYGEHFSANARKLSYKESRFRYDIFEKYIEHNVQYIDNTLMDFYTNADLNIIEQRLQGLLRSQFFDMFETD